MANEKRLIWADDAIAEVNKVESHHPWDDKDDIVEMCVNILHTAPTVDAVEVVHARWVRYEHGSGIYCSHCRHKRRYRDANDNYCPNCGAKMDGGNEDV